MNRMRTVHAATALALWAALAALACAADEIDKGPRPFAGGAPLKTDPELESQMRRAAKFAEQKQFNYAVTVWQYVLDKSGDTMTTSDGRLYVSLSDEVERILAKLPAAGLRAYRIAADGEAKAILANSANEENSLAEVVQRYFVSSLGDDAAYKLGCLALDRHDFIGASRLFTKILQRHPDPDVSRSDVWLRLALANAYVGDRQAARDSLKQAKSAATSPDELLALVAEQIDKGGSETRSESTHQWLMAHGNPARRGHMPSLPDVVMQDTLTELWGFSFPLALSAAEAGGPFNGGSQAKQGSAAEQGLVRWKSAGWMPSGRLLFPEGRVVFKTNNDLVAFDAVAVGLDPLAEHFPHFRSVWSNIYQVDSTTQMFTAMGIQQQLRNRPATPVEVMSFGDRIHHEMSISDGIVYSIEGAQAPKRGGVVPQPQRAAAYHHGIVPRRARKNWLAAYEASSGLVRWHRSPGSGEADNDVGFLAAPVPYGNLLLLPVTEGGTVWMYALSRADGSDVWKTYLCDEPPGGCSPWSPVGVAVDGRDVYVVCGTGVVFALDAVTGHIRFAVRYERAGTPNTMMRNFGGFASNLLELNGWDDDVVVPYGSLLVVMASDHDQLFALDRRTGEFAWKSPRTPLDRTASYCLGTVGNAYFVGGKNVLRRYNIDSGLLIWETEIEDSFGRAALTADAIYAPVGTSIIKFDLEKGQILAKVNVSLSTNDPVGNLYSDGRRLWVHGANRIYTLTNLQHRLAMLQERIDAGDAAARLDRMRLWAKSGDLKKAVADLLAAHRLIEKQQAAPVPMNALLTGMREIDLAHKDPLAVLSIVAERLNTQQRDELRPDPWTVRRSEELFVTLRAIYRNKTPHAVERILAVSKLLHSEGLRIAARQALVASVGETDQQRLQQAVSGNSEVERSIAAEPLVKIAGAAAKEQIQQLVDSTSPRLKLAGARALCTLGERAALQVLFELMQSGQPAIAESAARALRSFTGKRFGFNPHRLKDRERAVAEWETWIDAEGAAAPLNSSLAGRPPILGRTLVISQSPPKAIEFDSARRETWNFGGTGMWRCRGLPSGNRLIAYSGANLVVELDRNGNEVWRASNLPGSPFSVQRLENGNTLVACSSAQKVVEVRPDGTIAWQRTVQNFPVDARRLKNGNTLVACQSNGRVVEIDPEGNVVWELVGFEALTAAQPLENGNILVAELNRRQVVEVRRKPKNRKRDEVWKVTGLNNPQDAQRLPNGNTLIVDINGVFEVGPDGKRLWQKSIQHCSSVSRY